MRKTMTGQPARDVVMRAGVLEAGIGVALLLAVEVCVSTVVDDEGERLLLVPGALGGKEVWRRCLPRQLRMLD